MPWGCRAGKIRNSGARKTVLLAVRSGARRVPRNFVPLVRLRGTRVCLIVYLVVYHICKIILNSALDNLCYYYAISTYIWQPASLIDYAISTYIWQPASLIDRPTVLVICRNQNWPQSSVIFWCFYPYEIYAQWSISAGLDNQLASASKLIKWGKNKYKNPTNLLSILFAFATIQHGHQVAAAQKSCLTCSPRVGHLALPAYRSLVWPHIRELQAFDTTIYAVSWEKEPGSRVWGFQ